MTIFLSALGVAFAAFCVWLAVRIFNRRERWAKWTAVGVVLLAYPLSLGPLTWLDYHGFMPKWTDGPLRTIYGPLVWVGKIGVNSGQSEPKMNALGVALLWYSDLWWK